MCVRAATASIAPSTRTPQPANISPTGIFATLTEYHALLEAKEKPGRKFPTGQEAINSLSRSDIKLTLAELESATGALATVLLGFLDTRVAGQEAIAAQHGA